MTKNKMASVSSFLLQILPIFLIFFLSSLGASSAKLDTASSYAQHCGSIVPESSPTKLLAGASSSFLITNGFYTAGEHIKNHLFPSSNTDTSIHESHSPSIFHFQPGLVHRTHDSRILQLEGTLVLLGSRIPYNMSRPAVWSRELHNRRRIVFKLSGFWSEDVGKICMIGIGEIHSSQEDQVASKLSVVLKLEYPNSSNITTSIIKGSIESTVPDTLPTHFEPLSLLAYAQRRYEYTVTHQAEESCSHVPPEKSVQSDSISMCTNLRNIMQYETFTSSDLINFLGFRFLSTSQFVCSDDGKVHMSMTLSNKTTYPFDGKPLLPGQSLVAEGVWDHHNSRLCLLACALTHKENNSSSVGDCSFMLTFWFPVSFSLKQRSAMVARMWKMSDTSNDNKNTIVSLYSIDRYSGITLPGLKYEYTKLDMAKKYCKVENNPKITGNYPDVQSQMDMRFRFSLSRKNDRTGWGQANQISVGESYQGNGYGGMINEDSMYTLRDATVLSSSSLAKQNQTVWDVGYALSYTFFDKNITDGFDISAEGIYNSITGRLCLIGCRRPNFRRIINGELSNSSVRIDEKNLDCTVFIQLQLPSLDSRDKEGKGTISSTRVKSDPLYFEPIVVKLHLNGIVYSMQEYDRMDSEMIMVIISLTFLSICSYLQLRHMRKCSTLRSLTSITMIVVLTLGCMVSLILNTEAMLIPSRKRHIFLQNGGWIDATNTIARLITMVTLLINYRLLQLAWGSRSKEEKGKVNSWGAEKKSILFCVPLYIAGALLAWFVHSHNSKYRRSFLKDLACYVGLVVDNFLFPQIIFNVFSQSKEKVLNPFFYVGVTSVHVVPHIYNAYRAWWHPENFDSPSYIYANHGEDYYSKLFDIIVPLEGLLFVLLIYLQQRFGGRCFFPKRLKNSSIDYEPVYVSDI